MPADAPRAKGVERREDAVVVAVAVAQSGPK